MKREEVKPRDVLDGDDSSAYYQSLRYMRGVSPVR